MLSENFIRAHKTLGNIEGGYSNNPNDPGGETIYGWARKKNPGMVFWAKVDEYKAKYGGATKAAIAAILADEEIKQQAKEAYKERFWDYWGGDDLPYSLAMELLDFGVNCGVGGCAKQVQRCLNALNYQNKFGPDLKVDGDFGNNSHKRLTAMVNAGMAKAIQFGVNALQGAFYISLTETDQNRREFCKGWLQQRCDAVYEK